MRIFYIHLFTLLSSFLFIVGADAQTNDSINSLQLSEVEIAGSTRPSTSRSTTPLQIMTSDRFEQEGMMSVADAVKRFNGIVLKDYGGIGGLKTVSIRGMGAEHTAISYDGIMVSNMQSGQVDISRFSLDNISLLSLSIGQSDDIFQSAKAFSSAGVLNLQTKTPVFSDKSYNGLLKITAGSFGLFNPALDYQQRITETFAATLNVNWQRADGNYPFTQEDDKLLPDRKRRNSDTDILRTELNLYNDFGTKGNLKTKFYFYNSDRGLPGSVVIGNDFARERLLNRNFFVQTSYNTSFNKKLKFKSQAKYDNSYTRYSDVNSQYVDRYGSNKIQNRYTEQEVYWSNALLYQVNKKINLSLAQDLSFNKLENRMAKPLNEGSVIDLNKYFPKRYGSLTAVAAQYNTQRLVVTASLLMTYVSEKNKSENANPTYKRLTPAISLSYSPLNLNALRLRASYKGGFRIPTFTELYYSSIAKSLKPESADQFNIGATWISSIESTPINLLKVSVDGYYNKIKDKIVIVPTLFIPRTMNLSKVDMKGIDVNIFTEIELSSKIKMEIEGVYSYMHAIDLTSPSDKNYKDQIPYTPKHSGSASLGINTPWVNLSYTVLVAGERYINPQNISDYKLDGYSDHSISLYKQLKINEANLYLQGSIQNIGNKNYSIIKYYPMPGRSFRITAGYKF